MTKALCSYGSRRPAVIRRRMRTNTGGLGYISAQEGLKHIVTEELRQKLIEKGLLHCGFDPKTLKGDGLMFCPECGYTIRAGQQHPNYDEQ